MHVVPRSQMGMGVEENGVLGCPFHHSLLDNGNKGLRPEMVAMLEEYLKGIYPGWSREMVTSAKKGRTASPKENIKTAPQPVFTGCSGDLDGPPAGFRWLSHDKEEEKEMAVREDCFGYGKNMKRCTILKETYCTKGPCNFYKTQKQHQKEMAAAGLTDQKGKET